MIGVLASVMLVIPSKAGMLDYSAQETLRIFNFVKTKIERLVSDYEESVYYMARTIWAECRSDDCMGSSGLGMRAVGHVIYNRMGEDKTVKQVVLAKGQFTCWSKSDPNYRKMQNVENLKPGTKEHSAWVMANIIAREILSGESADPTNGATFYHNRSASPAWRHKFQPTARISGHIFYRR